MEQIGRKLVWLTVLVRIKRVGIGGVNLTPGDGIGAMTCDTIVLDLDGTLIDSASLCTAIISQMRGDRGHGPASVAQARDCISLGADVLIREMMGLALGDPEADLAEFRARHVAFQTPDDCLYDGVRDGLKQMRDADVRVALCSNKPQSLCEKILNDLRIVDHFSAIVGSSPQRPGKPDPAMLIESITQAGGTESRSVLIGDSDIDHRTALAVSVPFIFATYGYATPHSRLPSWTADNFSDAVARALDVLNRLAHPSPPVASFPLQGLQADQASP